MSPRGILLPMALMMWCCLPMGVSIGQECDVSPLRVKDGDSFLIWSTRSLSPSLTFREEIHIHLDRVRTPPLADEAGLRAKETLSDILLTHRVGLTIKKPDRYGGYVAEVYLCQEHGRKVNINDLMIAHGWGWRPE